MIEKVEFISDEDYKKILEMMPIPCVDVVLIHDGKFLLGKRKNEPGKEWWWIFGGRVFKGETLEEAAVRKVEEEVGINIDKSNLRFLGTSETMFDVSQLAGSTHTINTFFSYNLDDEFEINLDGQNSETKWSDKIDPELHPYLKLVLRKSGFK